MSLSNVPEFASISFFRAKPVFFLFYLLKIALNINGILCFYCNQYSYNKVHCNLLQMGFGGGCSGLDSFPRDGGYLALKMSEGRCYSTALLRKHFWRYEPGK